MSNPTINLSLFIDLKTQDRLRKWFSERGSSNGLTLTGLSLGDSEINYKLSQQFNNIKILPTPYEVPRIKCKLIYEGNINNITGIVTTYLRKVNSDGSVSSLYNFITGSSNNLTFIAGNLPPALINGYDWGTIPFDPMDSNRQGFIVFCQTVPDNYYDNNGNPLRLKEQYDIIIDTIPLGWEVIIDDTNGSFLIAKPADYIYLSAVEQIRIKGRQSGISKILTFNF
jgi:hypothetical protein